MQDVRADGADANHDPVVAEQREERSERRAVVGAGERHPHGGERIARGQAELPGDRGEVGGERQAAQFRLIVDVLRDRVEEEQHLAVAQAFELERRQDDRFFAQARDVLERFTHGMDLGTVGIQEGVDPAPGRVGDRIFEQPVLPHRPGQQRAVRRARQRAQRARVERAQALGVER